MGRSVRTEDQARFIELNRQFMDEVEKGATWSDLRWLIDEMKQIAKDFEHLEPAKVIAMREQQGNSPFERER